MTTAPKTEYFVGDALDVTGGKVTLTYADQTTKVIDLTAAMVSGFDSATAGEKALTVTYEGKTATYTVQISEAPASVAGKYRWELNSTGLVSVITDGNTRNDLTKLGGSMNGANLKGVSYQLAKPVELKADRDWYIEWKTTSSIAGTNSSLLFANATASATDNVPFIFLRPESHLVAIGSYNGGYQNYGIQLDNISTNEAHVYRLQNEVTAEGNMVYLWVDGTKIGSMINHFVGGTAQNATGTWVANQNFTFGYLGTSNHPLHGDLTYVQVWQGESKAAQIAAEAAQAAQAAAETAKADALEAQAKAVAAQVAAEIAKTEAAAAQAAAAEAAKNAGDNNQAAENAKTAAEAAQAKAEAAQTAADTAKAEAAAAQAKAVEAQTGADAAKTAADAAAKAAQENNEAAAEEAKKAAEDAAKAAGESAKAAEEALKATTSATEAAKSASESAEYAAAAAVYAKDAQIAQKAAEEAAKAAEADKKAAAEAKKAAEAARIAAEKAVLECTKYQAAMELDAAEQKVDQSEYTAEQIEALAKAVSDAKAAVDAAKTQDEVAAAVAAGKTAIAAVEEMKPAEKPEDKPTEPTTPSEPEKAENPFVDIKEDMFCYDAVLWAYENEITTGKDATHFNPSGDCTRAQVVTFLWRAAGEPEPKDAKVSFPDVAEGKYYTKAVAWAVENGITAGYKDGTFGPNDTCTRGQIVTFLWRYADEAEAKDAKTFPDVVSGKFYADAVAWAVEEGITSGYKDGTFGPDKTCTRDQIVTFLYRYLVEE